MTVHDPSTSATDPDLAAYDARRRAARPHAPTPINLRFTARIDTEGLPPLFVSSPERALPIAQARRGESAIWVHQRNPRTGHETWDFWRTTE